MSERPMQEGEYRILCIEDDPAMVELISLILQNRGHMVVGAHTGRQGLELVEEWEPHLVMLDLMMPDMSGWDIYQNIKGNEATRDLPVIVVTAKAQNIDKVLGIRIAKVQDYITKPFSPAELIDRVERVLGENYGTA